MSLQVPLTLTPRERQCTSSSLPLPSEAMDQSKHAVLYHRQSRTHYVSTPYTSKVSTQQRSWNELKVKALSAAVDRMTASSSQRLEEKRAPLTLSSGDFDRYLLDHHSIPDRGMVSATTSLVRDSAPRPPLAPSRTLTSTSSYGVWGLTQDPDDEDDDFVNLIRELNGASGSVKKF